MVLRDQRRDRIDRRRPAIRPSVQGQQGLIQVCAQLGELVGPVAVADDEKALLQFDQPCLQDGGGHAAAALLQRPEAESAVA